MRRYISERLDGASGFDQLQRLLAVLPKRIRNGAMRKAGRGAAKIVTRAIVPLVPVSAKIRSKTGRKKHLRQAITFRVRTYNNVIFAVAGVEAGEKMFHSHLVEFGTRRRLTAHHTVYDEVDGNRYKRRNAAGTIVYSAKKVSVSRGQKYNGKGEVRDRGRMPPFHYMTRGWKASESNARQFIEMTIRQHLTSAGVDLG